MNSPESLQFLNNATKFYNLMMMYRCAIRIEILISLYQKHGLRSPIVFTISVQKMDMNLQQKIYRHISMM